MFIDLQEDFKSQSKRQKVACTMQIKLLSLDMAIRKQTSFVH